MQERDIFPSVFSENEAPIVVDSRPTIGELANEYADQTEHIRYGDEKAAHTLRRQKADLKLFFSFLEQVHYEYPIREFLETNDWTLWSGITHGLIVAFLEWQKREGYAVGSINVRLATIKTYCGFAHTNKAISYHEYATIKIVKGLRHKDGVHLDKKREVTRRGKKKATATSLNVGHALALKRQENVRDAVMMCLLLDHGLRVGELVSLKVEEVLLSEGKIVFYREKVDMTQTHRLTPETIAALNRYMPSVEGPYLFQGYRGKHMSTRRINKLVAQLGASIGLPTLSPHDCRHYWSTAAVRNGTDIKALQVAGGWKSPYMALRYAEENEIANEGVKLG